MTCSLARGRAGRFPLFLFVVCVISMAASAPVYALAGTPFEGADGNLTIDALSDWQSFVGGSELMVGIDLPPGQTDDSLKGKENDPAPEIVVGSIPQNKSDLLRFYVVHENLNDTDFMYLGWVRANTLGTANMDFEFNQSTLASANGATPVRTPGDLLIT